MRISAAVAVAMAMAATPAFAQDSAPEKSFDGPSVTVIAGVEETGNSSHGNEGAFGGFAIGYDHQAGKLVFGIEGEATLATTERCAGATCNRAGRDLYAGGRIGYVVGGNTMVYAKAGYTDASVPLPVGKFFVEGLRVGGGVETRLSGRTFVRAEYRYSDYDAAAHKHQGTVGFGIRF